MWSCLHPLCSDGFISLTHYHWFVLYSHLSQFLFVSPSSSSPLFSSSHLAFRPLYLFRKQRVGLVFRSREDESRKHFQLQGVKKKQERNRETPYLALWHWSYVRPVCMCVCVCVCVRVHVCVCVSECCSSHDCGSVSDHAEAVAAWTSS